MASTAAGESDGDNRKRSRREHNPAERDLPEDVVEEHRTHRRHFRDFDRRRPERRRSRTRSPPGARNGRRRRRSPSDVPPRPRPSFQHDEHCSAAREDEISVRRAFERGRWNGPKEPEDKFRAKGAPGDLEEEKSLPQTDHSNVWKHNGYHELEAEAQPTRKRPAFRETKTTVEEAARTETIRPPRYERPVSNSYRREDERNNNSRLGRNERIVAGTGDRDLRRADACPGRVENPRYGYQSRERYNGAVSYRARGDYNGRHNGRNSMQSGGFQVEKWKHDLFDDANRSPKHKSEEEHVAKVEALLAL